MEPFFYRPPFLKHLHNLVINGFYARDLDADDFAFLEYVKHHGVANGSLPGSESVLLEELEFWQLPYGIAPDVERHIGMPARPIMTAEQRAARRAKQNAWHARRVIREQERAIAEAELERERCEYEKAKKRRELRELLADAEWEAAAPHKAKFGKTIKRHYVPQWKLDDEHHKKSARKKQSAKAKQRKRERLEEAAKAAERERQIKEKAAQVAAELEQRAQEAVARAVAQDQERQRREQVIEEARQTIERLRNDLPSTQQTADELKRDILTLLRGSQITGHVWSRESIIRATGCSDNEFLDKCLDELVHDGRLKKKALAA